MQGRHKWHYHLGWKTHRHTHTVIHAWKVLSLEGFLWNYKKDWVTTDRVRVKLTCHSVNTFELRILNYVLILLEILLNQAHLTLYRCVVKRNLWKKTYPRYLYLRLFLPKILSWILFFYLLPLGLLTAFVKFQMSHLSCNLCAQCVWVTQFCLLHALSAEGSSEVKSSPRVHLSGWVGLVDEWSAKGIGHARTLLRSKPWPDKLPSLTWLRKGISQVFSNICPQVESSGWNQ